MPKFLFLTTISRHDARLSSTTHCALHASRINYNLTNLSRCNSFLQYFSSMDLCSSLPSSPFLSNSFQCFLVILQALSLSLSAKITKLPSDSPGSRCQSHHNNLSLSLWWLSRLSLSLLPKSLNLLHNKTQITHATQLNVLQLSRCYLFSSRLPLLPGTLSPISTTSLIQHWGHRYFNLAVPRGICLRYAHASHKPASFISASKSLRWSRYIAMMSRWFALKRTSSSNGKSHSKRTIRVCTSLKTLVTLSKPIIQPISWSSTASRNDRVLRRLSILSTDRMAIFFFVHRHLSQTRTNNKLVQTHHLCLQGLTSTSVCLSNQLTYFSLLISRQVVGAFTVQTPHLCLQD